MTVFDVLTWYFEIVLTVFDGIVSMDDAKRYKIVCLFATGCTNKEVAKLAGVSLSSIERLKRDPEFKSELSTAINQIYRAGLTRITLAFDRAITQLLEIIDSKEVPHRTKLKAIEILFKQADAADTLALQDRVSELEKQAGLKESFPTTATRIENGLTNSRN